MHYYKIRIVQVNAASRAQANTGEDFKLSICNGDLKTRDVQERTDEVSMCCSVMEEVLMNHLYVCFQAWKSSSRNQG